jgi:hypothetical protein
MSFEEVCILSCLALASQPALHASKHRRNLLLLSFRLEMLWQESPKELQRTAMEVANVQNPLALLHAVLACPLDEVFPVLGAGLNDQEPLWVVLPWIFQL